MTQPNDSPHTIVTLRVREFDVPPIRDCLVIGRKSPIGCVAMRKALALLRGDPFEDLHPDDDIVSDILVRSDILKLVHKDKLIALVLRRVKPMMSETQIMHLDINIEVMIEDQV